MSDVNREVLARTLHNIHRNGYQDSSVYIRSYENLPESWKERWRSVADYVIENLLTKENKAVYLELGE